MISTEGKEDKEYLMWYFCQLNWRDCQDDLVSEKDAEEFAEEILRKRRQNND